MGPSRTSSSSKPNDTGELAVTAPIPDSPDPKASIRTGLAHPTPPIWEAFMAQRESLFRQCLQLMGNNVADAEDAFGIISLKLWQRAKQEQSYLPENCSAWFRRVAHNVCIDLHRDRKRRGIHDSELSEDEQDGASISTSALPAPDALLQNKELREVISRQIASLAPQHRIPFVMRCYDDTDYPAIAARLGLTQENVRKRVQLAREKLAKALTEVIKDHPNLGQTKFAIRQHLAHAVPPPREPIASALRKDRHRP